ncbi:MAG: PEP-CTERM sorting domain-containing protein [Acidobacteria bacterium]|nr:PEP-CTERM sorting domain-containing protein [Acidobacteriota bacterium]
MRNIGLGVFLCLVLSAYVYGESISIWNFNDAVSGTTGGLSEFLVDRGNGVMTSSFISASIGNTTGSNLNSRDGDPAGQALRLSGNANNGENLTWLVNTTGYEEIDVSFATQRTSTGFSANQFQYSFDAGVTWLNFGDIFMPGTGFVLQEFNLSAIPTLSNNPYAGFRIVFGGASGSSGNNRIDNLVVAGTPFTPPVSTPVPEPSTIALTGIGIAGVLLTRMK